MSIFETLKAAALPAWKAYTEHPFLSALAAGTLDKARFQYYLRQDYLFLLEFARAYALLAYKSETPAGMRYALSGLKAILDTELALHLNYCRDWGLSEAEVLATKPSLQLIAYTRFVLDTGQRGDSLDLLTALAPCIIGYAEIGQRLAADPATLREGNPYFPWIALYGGADYGAVAAAARAELESAYAARWSGARLEGQKGIFQTATELEAAFWPVY